MFYPLCFVALYCKIRLTLTCGILADPVTFAGSIGSREPLIMLKFLPIMLYCSSQKLCLLCSNYAHYCFTNKLVHLWVNSKYLEHRLLILACISQIRPIYSNKKVSLLELLTVLLGYINLFL